MLTLLDMCKYDTNPSKGNYQCKYGCSEFIETIIRLYFYQDNCFVFNININSIKNMEKNRLADQLKKHIEEVGEEAFKQEVFEFNCEYYGIDSKAENAKMKLQMKQWQEMFKYKQLPKIRIAFDFIITLLWMFLLGIHLAKNKLVWIFMSVLWAVYFGIRTWNNLFKED